MAEWDSVALPASHVFITLAHRRSQKTLALPRWLVCTALGVLAIVSLWLIGCTVYVAGHDSLLAGMMRRQRDMQYGYEDRIAALKRELDQTTSQHALLERTVGTRLDALSAQEADLRRNAGMVAGLAEQFLHEPARAGFAKAAQTPRPSTLPSAPDRAADPQDAAGNEPASRRVNARLGSLTQSLGALASAQAEGLTVMQSAADKQVTLYRAAFEEAGLSLSRFATHGEASGGPFVPLDAAAVPSPFERASLALKATLTEAERLRGVASHVPFAKPLEGSPEVTSPFGARLDPFLGRPALHTGIDLRDETGTAVLATAVGRVSFAGTASGYGVMVEIDHGNGLTTRYAHLSAVTVAVGDTVGRDEIVGRVGATGRATGPHLHYETRIDGEPVDPMRFLAAGRRFAATNPQP